MCGLLGFIGSGNEKVLRRMTELLTHRGPDSSGYLVDNENKIYIGHRRLEIIDILHGSQPMFDEEKNICVVYNGEIYNHKKLKKELESFGYKFKTSHSDTEVIVHGWKHWRENIVSKIDGMFSIAIYDKKNQTLFLARDRYGEKPLYYSRKRNTLAFSSEIKPLLEHPEYKESSFSSIGLQKYFAHGFFPSPHTPFSGIHKLPPGHFLKVDLSDLSIKLNCYWKFQICYDNTDKINEEDLVEELEELLIESVSDRLESDVALGMFLSGGIDSSSILACASLNSNKEEIKTFSIGFLDKSYDETKYAIQVSNHFQTKHKIKYCDINNKRDEVINLLSSLDEPIGDPSIYPTYQLCKLAKEDTTVVLSGDGGDELFAGYDPFKVLRYAEMYNSIVPIGLNAGLQKIINLLPISDKNMSLDFILKRGFRGLKKPKSLWNPLWLAPFVESDIADLFNQKINSEELFSEVLNTWEENKNLSTIDQTLLFYTRFYLPESILMKTDRSSMKVGLEVRSPFLSKGIADFTQRLPTHLKMKNGITKWILKKSMSKHLPKNILNRKKKGFGIPVSKWLRNLPIPENKINGLNSDMLNQKWLKHKDKKIDERGALWCWLALSQTYQSKI